MCTDTSPQTIGEHFEQFTHRFGPRPALLTRVRYRTEQWTYARLHTQVGRVVAALQEQGIRPGDRVVLWGPNSPWWVAAYFGCLSVGAALVPLDMLSSPAYISRVLEQTAPSLAILSHRCRPAWEYPSPAWYLEDLDRWLAFPTRVDLPVLSSEQPAEILYTSGTTGTPKGVVLSHRNVLASLHGLLQRCPPYPDSRLLSLLPLSHMLEQMGGLLLPLGIGAGIYYPASRRPSLLVRDLREQRIDVISGVPQIFALFMQTIEQEVHRRGKDRLWRMLQRVAPSLPMQARRLLFHSVHRRLGGGFRFLVSGGAFLDPVLMQKWEALGVPMLQAYGVTEASPGLTFTALDDRLPGSVGTALAGVQLRIGEDGEVLARGANITGGYWRDPQTTAAAFQDGWYRTGDLGSFDTRGHLYLRGRKRDLIVRQDGLNVYPEDVERELLAIPDIEEAVVVERPGGPRGQVHAVLRGALSQDGAAALVQQVNRRLAPHQQIQGYTLWPREDFPRTHTFKIRKGEISRILASGELPAEPAPRAAAEPSPLLRLLTAMHAWPLSTLRPVTTLGELGIDSLGCVELLAAIEAECGLYLDEAEIGPDTSLAAIERLIEQGGQGARPVLPAWPLARATVRTRDALFRPVHGLLDAIVPETVSGREHLAGLQHPVIFVANHTSFLDGLVVLRALGPYWRRRMAVVTAEKYFTHALVGAGAELCFNAFRFVREGNVRPTLEHAAWLVDQRWSLLLFPEGTRSLTSRMAPLKPGIGMLAVELGVPVVPLHLEGLSAVLPRGRCVPHPGPVHVRIGRPLRFEQGVSYNQAVQSIEEALRTLTPADGQ